MPILGDILGAGMRVVFCGTAASRKSAEVGAPYAGPGNRFWEALYVTGLTPRLFAPTEYHEAAHLGIGLTNIAPEACGNDDILKPSDFDPDGLREKILMYQPRVLAFTSKRAAQEFFGVKKISYGLHAQRVGITQVFVLPSPSGAARGYWDITHWHALAELVRTLDTQPD